MIKNWRWFISKTLRNTLEDRKQICKMLAAQRDLIEPGKIEELEEGLVELNELCRGPIDKETLKEGREKIMQTADAILIPYPDPKYRDWVEMFLVVAALVLAFRTFFFQPFKIPTGSMQPTLFGITHVNLISNPNTNVPGKAGRVLEWFRGGTWYHLRAEGNWKLIGPSNPSEARLTKPYGSIKLTFEDLDKPGSPHIIRKVWYTWFDNPPYLVRHGNGGQQLTSLIALDRTENKDDPNAMIKKEVFKKGENIFKFIVRTGDHLFVNRITYNFRQPRRGDIAVFNIKYADVSHPLVDLPKNDTFYIKRLVAIGGDQVSIGADRHLRINGRRIDSSDSGFEFVYSHDPNAPVQHSVYSGHDPVMIFKGGQPFQMPLATGEIISHVPKNHFLMFGDNTSSSSDSRYWGAVPKKNVIGTSSFVYWPPLSPRFGWSHR